MRFFILMIFRRIVCLTLRLKSFEQFNFRVRKREDGGVSNRKMREDLHKLNRYYSKRCHKNITALNVKYKQKL